MRKGRYGKLGHKSYRFGVSDIAWLSEPIYIF